MTRPAWIDAWPALVGVLVAAAWPLSAYALSPVALPALLAIVAVVALAAWRPEYGIALALALAPWTNMAIRVSESASIDIPTKPFHILLPALAFGLLAYAFLISGSHRRLRGPWLMTATLIFAGVAVASSIQALRPSASINKLFILLTAVALLFAVLQICRERRQLLVVVTGALFGLLLASAQGVIQHYAGQFGPYGFVTDGLFVGRVQGSFGHPNQYAGFIAVLLPVAVAVVATRGFLVSMRWLAGVALVLAVPALVFSYTRGAIAAIVIGSLLWLAVTRPRTAVLTAVGIAISAIVFAPSALRERFDPSEASGDVPLRSDIWASAVDIYSGRPLLGVGPNNFADAYASLPATPPTASQRRLLQQADLLVPPHAQNLYLNILAEEGIIGLASFILLVILSVASIYRGCRVSDLLGRSICLGIGAGVMVLGVHSILEVTLLTEIALPVFALVAVAASFVALDQTAPAGA